MLKLFANRECPYVQRVLIALDALHLDDSSVRLEWIAFDAPPQSLLNHNPDWTVPLLEITPDTAINDSLQIVEFLDDLPHGQKPLQGKGDEARLQSRLCTYALARGFLTPVKAVVYPFGVLPDSLLAGMTEGFFILNHWLQKARGPFFGGDDLGFADVALAPFAAKYLLALSMDARVPPPVGAARDYLTRLVRHPLVARHCDEERVRRALELMFLAPQDLRAPLAADTLKSEEVPEALAHLNSSSQRMFSWEVRSETLTGASRVARPGQSARAIQTLEAVGALLGVSFEISMNHEGNINIIVSDPSQARALRFAKSVEEYLAQWPNFGAEHHSRFL